MEEKPVRPRPLLPARPRALVAAALTSALASASFAQAVLEVPGDLPTIQAAIYAAAPGDIVLVHGGSHDGPITIDRPLTLIGDPRPRISPPFDFNPYPQPPAIELLGSGQGRVVLCNLEVAGFVNGSATATSCAGIEGGGFDELHVIDCSVEGPRWVWLTGVAEGSPALKTSVPTVLVASSRLQGADSDTDACYGSGPHGPAGILAPFSTLLVLDSTVRGGGSGWLCGYGEICPTGGDGGPGIVAAALWEGGSDVQGGTGASYYYTGAHTDPCGKAADGVPLQVGAQTLLDGELEAEGRPRLGREWTLAWTTSGSYSVLFVGTESRLAPHPLSIGPLFIELSSVFLNRSYATGSGSIELRVPLDASLLGLAVVAQVHGGEAGWTRPLIELVRPGRVERGDEP